MNLKSESVCAYMRQTSCPLQSLSPPYHDRCDQTGCVLQCLFTSSPRQFSLSLHQRLRREQDDKNRASSTSQADPLTVESVGGAGGERRRRRKIFCLWKRAMEQVNQSSPKLKGCSSVVEWLMWQGVVFVDVCTIKPLIGFMWETINV